MTLSHCSAIRQLVPFVQSLSTSRAIGAQASKLFTMIVARQLPKRRYERYRHDIPIRAHVYASEATFFSIRGRCCELAEGGAGVTLNDQLPPGEVVALELSPTLKIYAAVKYLRGFYHGFEFVMVRDRQRETLQKMCAALAARHVKPLPAAQA